MRVKKPRVEPLAEHSLDDEAKSLLGEQFRDVPVYNVFRTLARSPKAYRRFMAWGGYILSPDNDLPPRERELVILRTGFNWRSGYEWAQHQRIGKDCGLADEEIEAIKDGPNHSRWNNLDRALLTATDELTSDGFVGDSTWEALAELSEKQRMDLVMTVGQYSQVAMMLNTFGVQLDEDLELDPDLADPFLLD